MSKFNPYNWKEVKIDETFIAPSGRLQVRVSEPAALYVTQSGPQGVAQALFGVASAFDVDLSAESQIKIDGRKIARAFVYSPSSSVMIVEEPIFTNVDRMSLGGLSENDRQLRMITMAVRQERQRERLAAVERKRKRVARLAGVAPAPDPDPVVEGAGDETS